MISAGTLPRRSGIRRRGADEARNERRHHSPDARHEEREHDERVVLQKERKESKRDSACE